MDPRDVLISKENVKLLDLPKNSIVATGSLRRRAQILSVRRDLKFEDIRGNIDTRLKKMFRSSMAALVLAKAGVKRMGLYEKVTEVIPEDICLPAAGQGAVAVETRKGDDQIFEIARNLNHGDSEMAVKAERAFLRRLGGGCHVPIGVLAKPSNNGIKIKGFVSDVDGSNILKEEMVEDSENVEMVGILLAEKMIKSGADKLLSL